MFLLFPVSIKSLKYSRNVFPLQINTVLFVVELFAQAVKKMNNSAASPSITISPPVFSVFFVT